MTWVGEDSKATLYDGGKWQIVVYSSAGRWYWYGRDAVHHPLSEHVTNMDAAKALALAVWRIQ